MAETTNNNVSKYIPVRLSERVIDIGSNSFNDIDWQRDYAVIINERFIIKSIVNGAETYTPAVYTDKLYTFATTQELDSIQSVTELENRVSIVEGEIGSSEGNTGDSIKDRLNSIEVFIDKDIIKDNNLTNKINSDINEYFLSNIKSSKNIGEKFLCKNDSNELIYRKIDDSDLPTSLINIRDELGSAPDATDNNTIYDRLNTLEGYFDGGEGGVDARIDTAIEGLSGNFNGTLEGVNENVENLRKDVRDRDSENDSKIGILEKHVTNIYDSFGKTEDNTGIYGRLNDLSNNIDNNSARIDNLENTNIVENVSNNNIEYSYNIPDDSVIREYLYDDIEENTSDSENTVSIGAGIKNISEGSIVMGVNSQAGIKGYYWLSCENITQGSNKLHKVKLSTSQTSEDWNQSNFDWEAGDTVTIFNDHKYVMYSTIYSVNKNDGEILINGLAPFDTRFIPNGDIEREEYAIFATKIDSSGKITIRNGENVFAWSSFTAGINNNSIGTLSTTFGYNNISAGDFSFTAGRNNVSGYAAITAGWNNTGLGEKSLTVGRNNFVDQDADNCLVGGLENRIYSQNNIVGGSANIVNEDSIGNIVAGYNNNVTDYCNAVFGDQNTLTGDKGRSLLTGSGNTVSGNFNITSGQNNNVSSDYNAVFGGYHSSSNKAHTVNGKYNIVSGAANTVSGNANAVSGAKHTVKNNYTLVSGEGCETGLNYQTVVGKYNIKNNEALFIVGNGYSSDRRNAFVVHGDGRATISSEPVNDMDVVNKKYLEEYFTNTLESFLINEQF